MGHQFLLRQFGRVVKALALGASPKGRGFEPHSCHFLIHGIMSSTIFLKGLPENVRECAILTTFEPAKDKLLSVRLARDQCNPTVCLGYGYLEFETAKHANIALSRYNGVRISGFSQRLNLSTLSPASGITFSVNTCQVYVGNLSDDVTDGDIYHFFKQISDGVSYATRAKSATGKSYGYGFVKFMSDDAAWRCIAAVSKKEVKIGSFAVVIRETYRRTRIEIERGVDHVTNTTVFVGNLPTTASEIGLRDAFNFFGPIESTRIVNHRGFGFVTFVYHFSALAALSHMQSAEIGGNTIHCMWGRMRPFGVDELAEDQYRTSAERFNQDWLASLIPQHENTEKLKLTSGFSTHKLPASYELQAELPESGKSGYLRSIVNSWICLDAATNI